MIDYIKFNNFYLFKQFIVLFKFQGFISTYIPTYIIKYTNNCKCMSVGYTETISGRKIGKCKLVQFNYYTVKTVLNYLALTYEWRGIAYRMHDVHLHKVVVLCSEQAFLASSCSLPSLYIQLLFLPSWHSSALLPASLLYFSSFFPWDQT